MKSRQFRGNTTRLQDDDLHMEMDNLELVWLRLWTEIRHLQEDACDDAHLDHFAAQKKEERIAYLRRKARRIRESLRN